MKTYYLKPPAISWGIVFPVAWIFAFYLRSPHDFEELVPGLIAMTILFSATAAEAVVINFELRIGSLERLLLAPINLAAVLMGKILGGVIFGFILTTVVTLGAVLLLGLQFNVLSLVLIIITSLFAFSSMGALACVLVNDVFEAQTLLNIPRFLMIFLCGVIYPVSALPTPLEYFSYFLPLTYTVNGLQQSLNSATSVNIILGVLILVAFTMAFSFPAVKLLARKFA